MMGAIFAVMGLSLLADICFTILFLRIPKLREGPGQLIFAQNQAQILLDLHWLSLLWTSQEHIGCACIGFITMTCFMLSCAYAAAICVWVSYHFDQQNGPVLRYHVGSWVVSVGIGSAMAAWKGLGTSALQTCSIRKGTWAE
jgi:hypothetical protein